MELYINSIYLGNPEGYIGPSNRKTKQDIMVKEENRRSEHQESLIGTDSYLNIYQAGVARDVL